MHIEIEPKTGAANSELLAMQPVKETDISCIITETEQKTDQATDSLLETQPDKGTEKTTKCKSCLGNCFGGCYCRSCSDSCCSSSCRCYRWTLSKLACYGCIFIVVGLFIIIFLAEVIYGYVEKDNKNNKSNTTLHEYRYTHLEFALEWAPGFCYNSTGCTDTIPDTWTIEGLWPSVDYTSVNYTSVDYTTYPVNCTKECSITSSLKDQIAEKVVETVVNEVTTFKVLGKIFGKMFKKITVKEAKMLAQRWPSYFKNRDVEKLWEDEWCEYGTCAGDRFKTETRYFEQAMELYDSVKLGETLEEAGITPNNETTYTIANLNSTLADSLGVRTLRYWCKEGEGSNKQVLYRVAVCVERSSDFTWQDCPGDEFEGQCDLEREFYLIPAVTAFGTRVFVSRELLFFMLFIIFWVC